MLRALGLGDLLTGVPALRGLARAFPQHRRVLAAPAALAPLIALMRDATGKPLLHGLIDAAPLSPLPLALAHADVAVNLHGRGPQSHRVLSALGPRRLLGFHHPEVPETVGAPRWRPDEHEVIRWCRMLDEHNVPCDPALLQIEAPAGPLPQAAVEATLVHPGAASGARRWPAERFARVAASERAQGRTVLITGSAAERSLAREVARAAGLPGPAVLAGATGLSELAALVAASGRVVCGDTGIAHLATALGTPSVVLFGPVSPAHWGPPAGRPHRALWAGGRGDPHGGAADPGLLRIGVADVLSALEQLDGEPALQAPGPDAGL